MGSSTRQLKAMLRKNWLLKIRHPFTTFTEILLPTFVMLMLIAISTRVDTRIHPVQSYIKEGMFVAVGESEISPDFGSILKLLVAQNEYLAFTPDTKETRFMLDALAMEFPLIKMVGKIYKDESDLENYIRSDLYGVVDHPRNLSNPKLRGAIVFHKLGPKIFDYSIRLNHTWAFSGFPDTKSIMDVNGPYLNDLELGMNIVPTLQYGSSGFLTLQQVMDSLLITLAQQSETNLTSEVGHLRPGLFIPKHVRIAPFPTREYTDDEFQTIVKRVMAVLYLLGFLYPVSRLISYSVYEKEYKIKEGLYMMGLNDEIFYLSWFITYFIQFAISSAIITGCTMNCLFLYSDKSLVFVYFFLFGISAIMLSFLISTLFSRAKAAAAVGTLSFLGAFFPYYSVNDPVVPVVWKVMASFLSPTAFALGTVNFADYEHAHVGLRWSNMWQSSSGVNFLVCQLMMVVDSFLYGLIGLYLDKVLPREYGVRYPWNFILTRSYWQRIQITQVYDDNSEFKIYNQVPKGNSDWSNKVCPEVEIEDISLDAKQQVLDGRCVQIKNLHKVYASKKGNFCAVNSLNLTLFENQILALLGHNGAGKSTTISMLVGLIPPTSGDAIIFGKSIRTHMDEVRKTLGVCPQNDILFAELTVKEHMEIFAILKGVGEDSLGQDVTDMIDKVGLADKTNTIVGSLSGGMKRKLSLGIALIGNSKVIILDEPTSGMDPYSMQSTWQLIKKIKKGRVILLTTHSMDEADVLGDRIAILANGHLRCCGSSLFLKHRYGVGYTLTFVKNCTLPSVATEIVQQHIPAATCLSDVGTEISFRLPLSSSSSFEAMFREIESCIRQSNQQPESSFIHSDTTSCIESYGISVTTLEEVFLRVSSQSISEEDQSELVPHSEIRIKSLWQICITFANIFCFIFGAVVGFVSSILAKFWCCDFLRRSTFWRHSRALFIKRVVSARRDSRTVMFQVIIPAVFLLFGLTFLRLKPHPDQNSIILTTEYFNPLLGGGGGGPIPFNLSMPIALQVASNLRGGWIQNQEPRSFRFPDSEKVLRDAIIAAGPTLGPALISMSEFLITSLNESYQSRYGAVVMDDMDDNGGVGYTVLHNSSCQHAGPTYINVVNAALLRVATGDINMTIQTSNHPLPMTISQKSQLHDLDAFSASIIVGMAFSFIPASFAVAIVKEREVKAKHQQLISGVSILSYWISTYIWDFVSFLFPTSLALVLFFIFGLTQFIGIGCLVPTIIIFLGYGLAVASSTYCLTFLFSDHSVAQNAVLIVHFFSGLILMVISFIMGLVEATKGANAVLKNFFRFFPGFCFTDGLASLALRQQDMKLGSRRDDGVLDWNITGASICYLAAEAILYFLLAILLEFAPYGKPKLTALKRWWHDLTSHRGETEQPLLGESSNVTIAIPSGEDEDVAAERQRVLDGHVGNAMIYLCNLRKVYPATRHQGCKVAVHSLAFSVNEGECFGFLGTNGAGKTTTLSMLTGEETPSDGTAYIFGNDIRSNPKAARRHIGYCPQFDALLEFLTVREHLELYARIKGVPESCLNDVVNQKLVEFDLWKSSDKPSYSLSGGNKRKLSVAIAMIGDPPIVILDEPSTGMDPIAKRFMWNVISRISTRQGKTAIILTTHSMNEAQALCTRIGIMVGGQLRCIGSSQHLKSRFGNYLELEVKPYEIKPAELDALCQTIQSALFDLSNHSKSILGDLETCIGVAGKSLSDNIAEISLTRDMVVVVGRFLGDEEFVQPIVCSDSVIVDDSTFGEQLSEQLARDGGIPLRIFSEWWLAKHRFSEIDSFILTSFPGATTNGFNGLSVKYQLPYGVDDSLADIFGHIEHNRDILGIKEYSVSQSTLETIFNHFAADQH
ncbi:ABC transporter A family member 1 [Rhynchospora pubera]|uniref:ABC transporter A family member 1 n=1 Tax=Rhynchospora pubera TaxID=906938 RepID=A0AAV8DGY8_9POAL|nr:ABC transporter A family member 1 [Rhynchospora pubera]